MKQLSFFLFYLMFFGYSLCSVHMVSANGISVRLQPKFTADKFPEGGTPSNRSHSNAFTFKLIVSGLDTSEYYKIEAKLESTSYVGYCANFGSNTDKDLKLKANDNRGWTWQSDKYLTAEISSEGGSVPAEITVRSYDWGAYGNITVSVKRRSGGMPYTATKSIPIDENKNQIADGWQNDTGQRNTLSNGKNGYNPAADDEHVPPNNNNDGDGWSVYDEYRGIFKKPTDRRITRLNPTKKDVFVCLKSDLQKYGTGSASVPFHTLHTLHENFVKDPWGQVYNRNGASVKSRISDNTGWVNFNSKKIPGFTHVWAIRIVKAGEYSRNKRVNGRVAIGSPSKTSKIMIYQTNVENRITGYFEAAKIQIERQMKKGGKNPSYQWTYTNKDITDAMNVMINATIAHEIGHCLNITHCSHRNCIMQASVNYQFNPNNKTLSTNQNAFDRAHNSEYAATGAAGSSITDCSCDLQIIGYTE